MSDPRQTLGREVQFLYPYYVRVLNIVAHDLCQSAALQINQVPVELLHVLSTTALECGLNLFMRSRVPMAKQFKIVQANTIMFGHKSIPELL